MRVFVIRFTAICIAFAALLSASNMSHGVWAAMATAVPTQAATPGAVSTSPTLALITGSTGGGASGFGNGLYILDIGSKTGKLSFSSKTGDTFFNTLSWSPDGNYLAFYNHASGSLAISDASGGNIKDITFGNVFAWTADGTQLTVATDASAPLTNIDISSGNATKLFPLSKTMKYVDYLRWSPDGTRLLYIGSAASANGEEIHVIDANGANDQVVLPASNIARYAMWSPDGQKIAYLIGGGNVPTASINIIDLATKKTTKIAKGALAADWSPDGKTFAYADGDGQLFLINADGSNKRAIQRPADLKAPIVAVAWRPPVKAITAPPASTSQATAAATSDAAAFSGDTKTFAASDKAFSFTYPASWTLKPQGTGTFITITVTNPVQAVIMFTNNADFAKAIETKYGMAQPGKMVRVSTCDMLPPGGVQTGYLMAFDTKTSALICASAKSDSELKALEPTLVAVLQSFKIPASS